MEKNEFESRICFGCGRKITFKEFCQRNRGLEPQLLNILWNNTHLEFFCCLCYDDYEKEVHIDQQIKDLEPDQLEVIKIVERKYGLDIPLVSKIEYNRTGFTIKENNISGLNIFRSEIDKIPGILSKLSNLEVLGFPWNNIQKIPYFIKGLKSLRELDLSGNDIKFIPAHFHFMCSLEELDLSFNDIQNIPEVFKTLPHLKSLNLIHNKIIESPLFIHQLEEKGIQILL